MTDGSRPRRGVAAVALEAALAVLLVGSAAWGAYGLNRSLPGAADVTTAAIPQGAVVVDARGPLAYRAGHIPGARQLWSRNLLSFDGPVAGSLADPETLARELTALGLEKDAQIVVYDDGDAANAPLVVLVLNAFGIEARMLLGGFDAWETGGGETTREVAARATAEALAAPFGASFDTRLVVDPEEAAAHLAENRIAPVDVRPRDAYLVEHVANAVHAPADLLLPGGALPRWSEIREFAERSRLTTDTHPLIYGADAVQAATGWLALRAYGIRHLHVHAGPYAGLVQAGLPVSQTETEHAVSTPSATVCWQ